MGKRLLNPEWWVSLLPNGIGQVKPNHYKEVVKAFWENRDQMPYAIRILRNGVCDGCALGTYGLRDFTMNGIHLCTVRLNLLRLNTMPAMDVSRLDDVPSLKDMSSAELRGLGRLPYPLVRRKGDAGFKRVTWDEAVGLIAEKIRIAEPKRIAFYLTSRGITNEVYYVAQKVARFLGTNNIDNASRLCHAPSTTALKETLGVPASTCSYKDWIGTDLLVLLGSNIANNQPVTTKYMYYAKQQGTRVLVVNSFREPGLERYWVPSVAESALFGTKLADKFFLIHQGGDVAFVNGIIKHLLENNWVDRDFIQKHTTGFSELESAVKSQPWDMLAKYSGATREDMLDFARRYSEAKSAVFVWSMGLTHRIFSVQNVKSVVNLALCRGMIGRKKCGLMAIRGHSGVQGGAEVGCVPSSFPGGDAVNEENAKRFEKLWGFDVPKWRGLSAAQMIDEAYAGRIDLLHSSGGDFLGTMPEPRYVREALGRIPVRIHQDIVVTSQMLVEPSELALLLPAATRYEQRGGGTSTSTERRVYFSPEIVGRRLGEARSEWEIFMKIAEAAYPERSSLIHFDSAQEIREDIAKAVPLYDGIQNLCKKGDALQWGGERLFEDLVFGTTDGLAKFVALYPPENVIPADRFILGTRRGKQFNTIVHADQDPLTGSRREDVLMSHGDVEKLGLNDGDPVIVRSEVGELRGRCMIAPIKPRNVQVFWPEGNVLIKRGVYDPVCEVPDYTTIVRVVPAAKKG
ncbi:MAG: FdhF/YdeP family oxidoreductase [Thaumarchaeota archaeon]|nr:FdhF/YdeP family oxidoreductase [Nitrososphaerota archaeon]